MLARRLSVVAVVSAGFLAVYHGLERESRRKEGRRDSPATVAVVYSGINCSCLDSTHASQ